MFFMTTQKPMTPTRLPLQVDLDLSNVKDIKTYSNLYRSKIGLKGTWYISKKYTGIRAIWTGKFFVDKVLMPIDNIPQHFTDRFPPNTCFDGVLQGVSFDYRNPTDWDSVTYVVFDYPKHNIPFRHRLEHLSKQIIFKCAPNVKLADYEKVEVIQNAFDRVNGAFSKAVAEGYPGIMLTEADSNYEGKRVPHLIEYTERHRGCGRIVSYHEGTRQNHKVLGKFKCIGPKNRYFFVSKNIPDDIRDMYKFVRTKCVFVDPKAPQIGDTLHFESDKMIDKDIPMDPLYVGSTPPESVPTAPPPKGRGEMRARRRGRKQALKRTPGGPAPSPQ